LFQWTPNEKFDKNQKESKRSFTDVSISVKGWKNQETDCQIQMTNGAGGGGLDVGRTLEWKDQKLPGSMHG